MYGPRRAVAPMFRPSSFLLQLRNALCVRCSTQSAIKVSVPWGNNGLQALSHSTITRARDPPTFARMPTDVRDTPCPTPPSATSIPFI